MAPGLPLPVTRPAHPRSAASGGDERPYKTAEWPTAMGSRLPESTRRQGQGEERSGRGACPQPGSRLQALQVLRQRVLLDVLLDVPAREVGLQVLLHHEVQGSLHRAERAVSAHLRLSPPACQRGSWEPWGNCLEHRPWEGGSQDWMLSSSGDAREVVSAQRSPQPGPRGQGLSLETPPAACLVILHAPRAPVHSLPSSFRALGLTWRLPDHTRHSL